MVQSHKENHSHLSFAPLALDVVGRGVQLTAGAPSLFCHPSSSFSPSAGLLGLSAAGAEGQRMPRRREKPLEI